MCKLLIGIQQNNQDKTFNKLFEAQRQEIKTEKDGIAGFIVDNNAKIHIWRDLHDYSGVFNKVVEKLDKAIIAGVHTRQRTTGSTSLENTHFFEVGDYVFAHNGIIGKYAGYNGYFNRRSNNKFWPSENSAYYDYIGYNYEKENGIIQPSSLTDKIKRCGNCMSSKKGFCKKHKIEFYNAEKQKTEPASQADKTDSLLFIENIKKPITKQILEEEVQDTNFMGFAFLYEKSSRSAWLINRKTVYFNFNNENNDTSWGLISTYKANNTYKIQKFKDFFGLRILVDSETLVLPINSSKLEDNITKLNIKYENKNK